MVTISVYLITAARPNIMTIEPLYQSAGGVQEEGTYLGIACLTLRKNLERPVTVS